MESWLQNHVVSLAYPLSAGRCSPVACNCSLDADMLGFPLQ